MSNYNLNRKKGTKIILLVLASSFIVVPMIVFFVHMWYVLG